MAPINNKKKRQQYTEDDMKAALEAINEGMNKHQASKTFNIPRTTLVDAINGKYTRGKHSPGIDIYYFY